MASIVLKNLAKIFLQNLDQEFKQPRMDNTSEIQDSDRQESNL
jgi:hypothetical protein